MFEKQHRDILDKERREKDQAAAAQEAEILKAQQLLQNHLSRLQEKKVS